MTTGKFFLFFFYTTDVNYRLYDYSHHHYSIQPRRWRWRGSSLRVFFPSFLLAKTTTTSGTFSTTAVCHPPLGVSFFFLKKIPSRWWRLLFSGFYFFNGPVSQLIFWQLVNNLQLIKGCLSMLSISVFLLFVLLVVANIQILWKCRIFLSLFLENFCTCG